MADHPMPINCGSHHAYESSDNFVMYSSTVGNSSWATGGGAFFIKHLTNTLNELGKTHSLIEIQLEVTKRMKLEPQFAADIANERVIVSLLSEMISTLDKDVRFSKPNTVTTNTTRNLKNFVFQPVMIDELRKCKMYRDIRGTESDMEENSQTCAIKNRNPVYYLYSEIEGIV